MTEKDFGGGLIIGFIAGILIILVVMALVAIPVYHEGTRINSEFLCETHGKKLLDYKEAGTGWTLTEVTCDGPIEESCEGCETFTNKWE